jgi:ubiquinone biosynthesis protein UbiJ
MKFRLLLWMLGLLMVRASRRNPAFQQQLAGKDLAFQLQTLDGKVARHFVVKDQRISSHSGLVAEPAFAISFKDAAFGFATLQAKNKQLAFMQGIQDKDIQIKGNPGLVIWFQGLMKYLKPRKRKPAKA